jgi:NAD(P)-dependent dehydrogenase (short-subunit alcohol dehydrogenase family)
LILNYTSKSSAEAITKLSSNLEQEYKVSCLVIQADMGTAEGPGQMVETAKEHFSQKLGKFQIDIVINNAGVARNAEIPDIQVEDFERIYRINVLGPIRVMQAALPYLPHDRSGRVVNVSSVSSSEGFIGQSVYGGTKAALEAMTRTWSRELAERATVNAINPGPVLTDMWEAASATFKQRSSAWCRHTPLAAVRPGVDSEEVVEGAEELCGRPAYVGEIGGIAGMLCTPDASWCTGQVVCANGGLRMVI